MTGGRVFWGCGGSIYPLNGEETRTHQSARVSEVISLGRDVWHWYFLLLRACPIVCRNCLLSFADKNGGSRSARCYGEAAPQRSVLI